MSTTPIWRGATGLVPTENWLRRVTNADGTTYYLTYQGSKAVCDAAEPAIGSAVEGVADTTHSVSETAVTIGPAPAYTLTIILSSNSITGGGAEGAGSTETTDYNLDIAQVERAIETHPYYATAGGHTDFTERLSDTITLDAQDALGNPIADTPSTDDTDIDVPLAVIWDHIKRLPFTQARQLYLRVPTANRPILTDLWLEWTGGQETYLAFAPQARAQDYSSTTPSVGDFGRTVTPPSGIGWPSGFQALRAGGTYNRPRKTGRFRREIHYLGAPSWPAKFYPPA